MQNSPLAYHITFGTYGTRLHGDPRGTVDRAHNRFGEAIIGENESRRQCEAARLREPPVVLTLEQRQFTQSSVPAVCDRGGWTYHLAACGLDHVHVLLSATANGQAVRRWLKVWLGQALSARWPIARGATWWAEGGSVKWVWDESYFDRARAYIERQRA